MGTEPLTSMEISMESLVLNVYYGPPIFWANLGQLTFSIWNWKKNLAISIEFHFEFLVAFKLQTLNKIQEVQIPSTEIEEKIYTGSSELNLLLLHSSTQELGWTLMFSNQAKPLFKMWFLTGVFFFEVCGKFWSCFLHSFILTLSSVLSGKSAKIRQERLFSGFFQSSFADAKISDGSDNV